MPGPTAGMITAVTLDGLVNGQRLLNTIHYRAVTNWSQTTIDTYYDAFHNQIKATGAFDIVSAFLAIVSSDYQLQKMRLQVVAPTRYRGKAYDSGAFGLVGTACTAQNVAAVITKQAELSGRKHIGSVHIGGLATSGYTGGELTSSTLTAMNAWKVRLLLLVGEDLGPGTNSQVIYHPKEQTNAGYTYVNGMTSQTTLRTQRTRNVGKGE